MTATIHPPPVARAPESGSLLLTGGEAVAHAMRQINPAVVPVYPITPQTPIIETFARFVADGEATTEIINVESEHSAMSAAVGAAAAGGRAMTATASQGLALMIEIVYIAASMRLPIVVAVGNRALSGPINIHCDHSDAMLARDSGVIQIFAENAQEAYDLTLIATRLAEHARVRLPVFVGLDGFSLTHSAEPVKLLPDDVAREFVGSYTAGFPLLDVGAATTQGALALPDYYFELKHQQVAAMQAVPDAFDQVAGAFAASFGRSYGMVESYRLDDAERAIVLIGSSSGTVAEVVDELRLLGKRVGMLTIRSLRPFPAEAIRRALRSVGRVAVLDRALSPGGSPPLFTEVAAAVRCTPVTLSSYVYGLGGRLLESAHVRDVFCDMRRNGAGADTQYLGLRVNGTGN